jgi:hypothetical protein
MMKRVFMAAILAVAGGPALAWCQPAQPFQPPAGFSIQSNLTKGANGKPMLFGGTAPDANWFFADMGAPGDLPPLTYTPGSDGGTWSSSAPWASVRLHVADGEEAETLSQDGSSLACRGPNGGIKEYDLGIWPNGVNPGYPSAIAPAYGSNRNFPSLSQLASFTIKGTLTVNAISQPLPVSNCDVNHAGVSYTVILVDEHVIPRQMFWYSVQFASFCLPAGPGDPGRDYRSCSAAAAHPHTWWYWSGAGGAAAQTSHDATGRVTAVHFAIGDVLPAYGQTEIYAPGQPTPVAIDFLPRLVTLITSGKDGVDPDPSHWRLAGAGYGQVVWGDTALSTTWQGFVPHWSYASAGG